MKLLGTNSEANQENSKHSKRVKQNLLSWKTGHKWKEIMITLKAEADVRAVRPAQHTVAPQAKKQQQLATRKVKQGRLSDAARVLVSDGVAPSSEDTRQKLQALHPQGAAIKAPGTQSPTLELVITTEEARMVLEKIAKNSAPGPSAMRNEHLLDMWLSVKNIAAEEERFVSLFAKLLTIFVQGKESATADFPVFLWCKPSTVGKE
jgi:hypothetical protein